MTTETMRLAVGAQVLNAAELIGFVLITEDCKEERSKMIANVLRIVATTVDGTDAYGQLMDAANEIETQAKRNIEAEAQPEADEWADQRRDEEQRDRFMEAA